MFYIAQSHDKHYWPYKVNNLKWAEMFVAEFPRQCNNEIVLLF